MHVMLSEKKSPLNLGLGSRPNCAVLGNENRFCPNRHQFTRRFGPNIFIRYLSNQRCSENNLVNKNDLNLRRAYIVMDWII